MKFLALLTCFRCCSQSKSADCKRFALPRISCPSTAGIYRLLYDNLGNILYRHLIQNLQRSQKEKTEDVTLKVCLLNGFEIELNVKSTDVTDSILEVCAPLSECFLFVICTCTCNGFVHYPLRPPCVQLNYLQILHTTSRCTSTRKKRRKTTKARPEIWLSLSKSGFLSWNFFVVYSRETSAGLRSALHFSKGSTEERNRAPDCCSQGVWTCYRNIFSIFKLLLLVHFLVKFQILGFSNGDKLDWWQHSNEPPLPAGLYVIQPVTICMQTVHD